jgi:hypothetical protein
LLNEIAEQSVSQRVIFSFGHKIGTYCISNGKQAQWYVVVLQITQQIFDQDVRSGLSDSDIKKHLKQVGKMRAFSLGENGACFGDKAVLVGVCGLPMYIIFRPSLTRHSVQRNGDGLPRSLACP